MSELMQAIQIMQPGDARVREVPIPQPGPGQVRTRVLAVTTCPQWDLHIMNGEPMFRGQESVRYPYEVGQPGHEMTGIVDAVGSGVTAFRPGDRVSAWRDQGHNRLGCYAEYVIHEQDNLLLAPPQVPPLEIASLELAMCMAAVFMDLERIGMTGVRRFGIIGLGPAGLIAGQMARVLGAETVIGFDVSPDRCAFGLRLSVDEAYRPGDELMDEGVAPRGQMGSLDVSVDCVGTAQSVRFAMEHTNRLVALFGVQREPYTYDEPGLTVWGYPGHSRPAAEWALDKVVRGLVRLGPLATHILPFEDYSRGVELLRDQRAVKLCLRPESAVADWPPDD